MTNTLSPKRSYSAERPSGNDVATASAVLRILLKLRWNDIFYYRGLFSVGNQSALATAPHSSGLRSLACRENNRFSITAGSARATAKCPAKNAVRMGPMHQALRAGIPGSRQEGLSETRMARQHLCGNSIPGCPLAISIPIPSGDQIEIFGASACGFDCCQIESPLRTATPYQILKREQHRKATQCIVEIFEGFTFVNELDTDGEQVRHGTISRYLNEPYGCITVCAIALDNATDSISKISRIWQLPHWERIILRLLRRIVILQVRNTTLSAGNIRGKGTGISEVGGGVGGKLCLDIV